MKHFDLSGTLPPRQQQALMSWYKISIGILSITLVTMVIIHGYTLYRHSTLKKQSAQMRQAQAQLTELKAQILALKQQQNAIATQPSPKGQRQSKEPSFSAYLECLTHDIPNDVRLESIAYEQHKQITLTGVTRSISQLTAFCTHLHKEHHFSTCAISSLKQQKQQPDYFDFVITTLLP